MKLFAENATRANRAYQVYMILIGCAHRRETITYGRLAELMGYNGVGHDMGPCLGCILYWCRRNNLPALNSIVVKRAGAPDFPGMPGVGVDIPVAQIPLVHAQVWETDWYSIVPPTPEELGETECQSAA